MTRRLLPPYLRLIDNLAVDKVSSAGPSPHDLAPAGITVRMQSTADAARRLADGAMDGLLNAAFDHGFTNAFGCATRDAIAEIVGRDLGAWVAQYETDMFDDPNPADRVRLWHREMIVSASEGGDDQGRGQTMRRGTHAIIA
jgi:hypothetical protein